MLVGTKDSEVVEVTVSDKDNPNVITQVEKRLHDFTLVISKWSALASSIIN